MLRENYIDGTWCDGRATIASIDPASETVLATVAAGDAQDIDRAVKAARRAFDDGEWSMAGGAARARVLRAIAGGILADIDMLAELEVRDNGKPLAEARWDIEDTAGCFSFYADLAESLDSHGEEAIALADSRFSAVARREPVGVAAAVIPWNYPMLMAAWKVAPALAAGCTMVLKPSELTPMTALELARIAHEAGVPAGVLNVVNGTGKDAGAPLVEHPLVDKIAFTGSVPTGSSIMQIAARSIRNISLELGGKSPFIVFGDSDVDEAVEWIMFGIFWNQGQVCSATSRVLVERSLYPALIERLRVESARIAIGDGMTPGVKLGPLVSKGQYDKVLAAIARGRSEGGRVVGGGGRPDGFDTGYFVEPTIFTDMPLDGFIWREEIFGPVVCVQPFDTAEEAVRLANDTRFGLAAAVMSGDEARAQAVARSLRAGILWVNCSQPTFVEAPWGGMKQSGIGRELGRWGLENYLETKQITTYRSSGPWGWYLGS
jgi:betaine-aldehyde dehydrogenase